MTKPVIVLTGQPEWAAAVRDQLSATYTIMHETEPAGYVARLTEALAALVLVDGAAPDWRYWTTTPKSSPATRRIPIVFVGEPAQHASATTAGADLTLTPDTLRTRAAAIVQDYARLPDPDRQAQLECECQSPLPPLAEQGFEKFNNGEYYAQHDLFEALWVQTSGPVRDLYRAILQVGVAYYQIERGNYRGALKMLQRSVQWLLILPDECQGIDVRQLREDSFRVRAELERLGAANFADFDHALIRPLRKVTSEPPSH